jgi:phenylpropionate dioxygenase-like ring-hydroxylating dioxygenase large terminal subunit
MNVVPRASQWDELIRPDRVHGSLYSDPAIFEAELQNIWYRTWVYVGHESEVPNANDYVVKSIGPQSIIMTRDEQGKVNLLLNRCSHRANQVCSYDKGNARSFTCPFHSWTFSNDGRLVGYAFPDGYEGQDKSKLALGRVTRVQSYRGFVFGSFAAEGPTLRPSTAWFVPRRKARLRSQRVFSSIASRPTGNSSWRTNATAITPPSCTPRFSVSPTAPSASSMAAIRPR